MQKKVRIDVEEIKNVDINELREFQGQLKTLSETDYQRLKAQILDTGFSFAIHVWQKDSSTFILDGHQRLKTLLKMREEGVEVPPVPVIVVKATTISEAKKKLLSAASNYGKIDRQGLYEYVTDAEIDIDDLLEDFRLPEIDMDSFKFEYFSDEESDQNLDDLEVKDHSEPKFTFKIKCENDDELSRIKDKLACSKDFCTFDHFVEIVGEL
jgi:hypothetical protein